MPCHVLFTFFYFILQFLYDQVRWLLSFLIKRCIDRQIFFTLNLILLSLPEYSKKKKTTIMTLLCSQLYLIFASLHLLLFCFFFCFFYHCFPFLHPALRTLTRSFDKNRRPQLCHKLPHSDMTGAFLLYQISLVALMCWLWPQSGARLVEPAHGCSLALATDCGPTPTHTLLANEASPQQNVAVNYRCRQRADEPSCAVRASLLIQLFKVKSFPAANTWTYFIDEPINTNTNLYFVFAFLSL